MWFFKRKRNPISEVQKNINTLNDIVNQLSQLRLDVPMTETDIGRVTSELRQVETAVKSQLRQLEPRMKTVYKRNTPGIGN